MDKKYKNLILQREHIGGQSTLKDTQSHKQEKVILQWQPWKRSSCFLLLLIHLAGLVFQRGSQAMPLRTPRMCVLTLLITFILTLSVLRLIQSRVFYTFISSSIFSAPVCRSSLGQELDTQRDNLEYDGGKEKNAIEAPKRETQTSSMEIRMRQTSCQRYSWLYPQCRKTGFLNTA